MSDGPAEVQLSVKPLKESAYIKVKNSNALPMNRNLWIGSGIVTKVLVENVIKSNPRKLVLGPNIDIHDLQVRRLFDEVSDSIFLVPSIWVKNFYVTQLHIDPDRVKVWAAGVDTQKWSPSGSKQKLVLIYIKGEFGEAAISMKEALRRIGLESHILKYGNYSQTEYLKLLGRAHFAVFLTGTESQGMAQFQSWSMDVPTLVLAQTKYHSPAVSPEGVEASSSPYLTEKTGLFFHDLEDLNSLERFIEILETFSPRLWLQSNFTLSASSQNFLELFA